ncbi:MAG TPA: GNAT family N-acetyltransferase [Candidatus Tectomicrobia bacterium]|nr:GNAT family N-acetyltransferase [Candidatus Tectomicrobia bacterium]
MDTEPKIRLAHEGDVEALVRLAAAFREHLQQSMPSDAELRTSIALLLKDADTEFVLACRDRGASLGYVQSRYRYSAWTSALSAELEDVFVIREVRRQGVGRRLVEYAIARAIERGCRTVGLNTNERNAQALALYQELGFVAERTFWKGGRQLWLERPLGTP